MRPSLTQVDPNSGEPAPIARLSVVARVETANRQDDATRGRPAAGRSFSIRNQPCPSMDGSDGSHGSKDIKFSMASHTNERPETWVAFRTGHMGYSFRFRGAIGCANRPACQPQRWYVLFWEDHASLLDAADCFGRHHACRQHNGFDRLSERGSPSLRQLGAGMCSAMGRRHEALQAMHAPTSGDHGLPVR